MKRIIIISFDTKSFVTRVTRGKLKTKKKNLQNKNGKRLKHETRSLCLRSRKWKFFSSVLNGAHFKLRHERSITKKRRMHKNAQVTLRARRREKERAARTEQVKRSRRSNWKEETQPTRLYALSVAASLALLRTILVSSAAFIRAALFIFFRAAIACHKFDITRSFSPPESRDAR